jgi:predicted nucleic acid-binding protein
MTYWDSSALVATISDQALEARLLAEGGCTRTHTLTEMFSALTGGNLRIRVPPNDAARMIRAAAGRLRFVNLTEPEILEALDKAQRKGIRGGRVHDYMHALAASKSGVDALLTTDRNDFDGLVPDLAVEQV